ncbi:hypothetical protein N7540_007836 [Penicillium herquei]|nr:hypothetical protein N7540_007836 [Penicillium herquei]
MQTQALKSPNDPEIYQTSHSRWLALTHRNPSSHSSFIYGVKSTKIYCRPTCPARLARRANVEFFDDINQAQSAGYRSCKRCQPDNTNFVRERDDLVVKIISLLRMHKADSSMKLKLKDLAQEVGVSPSYMSRVFKKTMGMTIGTYMAEFEKVGDEAETEDSKEICLMNSKDKRELEVPTTVTPTSMTLRSPIYPCFTASDDLFGLNEIFSFDRDMDLYLDTFSNNNFLDDSTNGWGVPDQSLIFEPSIGGTSSAEFLDNCEYKVRSIQNISEIADSAQFAPRNNI